MKKGQNRCKDIWRDTMNNQWPRNEKVTHHHSAPCHHRPQYPKHETIDLDDGSTTWTTLGFGTHTCILTYVWVCVCGTSLHVKSTRNLPCLPLLLNVKINCFHAMSFLASSACQDVLCCYFVFFCFWGIVSLDQNTKKQTCQFVTIKQ